MMDVLQGKEQGLSLSGLKEFTAFSVFLLVFALAISWYLISVWTWKSRTRDLPFPPGPPALPFVGNVLNIPRSYPWIAYRDLCAKYGDILHLRLFGDSIVVLGSASVILEYLEKRSANSSDKKQSPMVELSGQSFNISHLPYGERWRRHRRAFWQHFHKEAILQYRPVQRAAAHRFVEMLLRDPAQFKEHIRFTFGKSALKVVYGIDAAEEGDVYLNTLDETLEGLAQGLVPGKFFAEFFPFLRHIPPWLPGARSARLFAKWQAAGEALKNLPYSFTKDSMDRAEVAGSMIGQLIATLPTSASPAVYADRQDMVKNVGAVAFEGGADTMYSALQSFFLAMSLHPEVVGAAHAELDAIVGPDRLPEFCDQDSLVYVNAIIKETLRWQNGAPLGGPHLTIKDDELHGFFIPAKSMIIANVWACMHDPDAYEDPDMFRPERFIRDGKLDPSVRDPYSFVFGFGRRVCPGRYFALNGLFINIACVLHCFDIGPPIGNDGQPIRIIPSMTDGLLSYPEDSRCVIRPRSRLAEALITATVGRL